LGSKKSFWTPNQARYLKNVTFNQDNIEILRQFYADAQELPVPAIKLFSWQDVAVHLQAVYTRVLK
jgi:hypothetical protein